MVTKRRVAVMKRLVLQMQQRDIKSSGVIAFPALKNIEVAANKKKLLLPREKIPGELSQLLRGKPQLAYINLDILPVPRNKRQNI